MDPALEAWLAAAEITYELFAHKPVFTVAEAQEHCQHVPGTACKNLFVKDSKLGQYYLVTAPSLKPIRLNAVRKLLGAKKLHFASPEELMAKLGLIPGAVSPLGLVNNREADVIFVIDHEIWDTDLRSFHPNDNAASITVDRENFQRFVVQLPQEHIILDIPKFSPET